MRTVLFGTQQVLQTEMRYYLLAEEFGNMGESYGVRIDSGDGDSASLRGITLSQCKILLLMDLIMRNTVTPVALQDVVEDWLVL